MSDASSEPRIYQQGHVKRNPATGEVALRTIFEEALPRDAIPTSWLVATKHRGARNVRTEEVEDWEDLYVPPQPEVQ